MTSTSTSLVESLAERIKERRSSLIQCIRLLLDEGEIDGYTLKKINGALGAPIIDCPTPFNHQISLLLNINTAILEWWEDEEEKEEAHMVDLEEAYGLHPVTSSIAREILKDIWAWEGRSVPESKLVTIGKLHRVKMVPASKLRCNWDHFISYLKLHVADDRTVPDIYLAIHPFQSSLRRYLLIPEDKVDTIFWEIKER